ncbi:MAG: BamA/TamA family outer membrane protein [bacterium]|nr:BamA/TamA family outer membrane protein [bacterium]
MKIFRTLILLFTILVIGANLSAQETYFGKNKVRYKDFEWSYIQTRHFDIHFYEDAYKTAKFSASVLESSYVEITRELNYRIQKRIPVFVYNSHNDFQQTNIISSLISEGIGGFTEAFKNRIVIPFTGSYEDFRHVLHHELTHAVIYDMVYGNVFSSLLSRQRLFNLPLWYAEGYAEYSSRHGWDYFSDMFVRDATINGYLTPPAYLGGFLAYKQGQAMVKYIADTYGEQRLGEILRKGKIHLTMNKALKDAIGIEEKKLWEDFSKEMKRRYWPEIALRKDVDEVSHPLTKARKDGSYFNEKPEFLPDGDHLIFFSDQSDFTEIVMISTDEKQERKSLVKSQRSGDLESLHSYVSGVSVSPDGRNMVFVAKSQGKEALFFYDLKKTEVYQKKSFDYYNIMSPVWSPDGLSVAFTALKGHTRDLFVYDIKNDGVRQLTNDRYDDVNSSWLPDSRKIIFSSDRPHPQNLFLNVEENIYVRPGAFMPGDFKYGQYNLFEIDLSDLDVKPIDVGPGDNKSPRVSPDGEKVAFISNRNGIDNIYVAYLDTTRYYALTDILSGITSLSWSPEGDEIAFSAFHKGAFDVFILEDLVPAGEDGKLAMTDFMLGKYDLLRNETARKLIAEHRSKVENDEVIAAANDPNALPTNDTLSADSLILADDTAALAADSTLLAAVEDSLNAAPDAEQETSPAELPEEIQDSIVTESGIYDDEFVHVSQPTDDPLDSLMQDVRGEGGGSAGYTAIDEPASFDSIPSRLDDGEYAIKKYRAKFTPDYVGGGFSYDTFFGLRGQSFFVFSDYLGNHQFYLATDLVNTIDQSNLQLFYFYNKKRTNLGVGLFHTKNFYLDATDFLFSDRFYGIQALANRPFSTFSRIELTASHYFIDRQYYDLGDDRSDRSSKVATGALSYTFDNVLWGITGPVNGRRIKVTATHGVNLFDASDISFSSVEFDYRKYWHLAKTFTMAWRLSGGASFGKTPKQYFMGGTTNWIGNQTLDAKVYEVENLYFADVVTPLRSVDYYSMSGTRYGLMNWEFRFPMIEYFAMRYPLPLIISRVQGALFLDMGATWEKDRFKGGSSENGNHLEDIKSGFGYGMRANLGFIVLRFDQAWGTDFREVSDKPSYYLSIGADF